MDQFRTAFVCFDESGAGRRVNHKGFIQARRNAAEDPAADVLTKRHSRSHYLGEELCLLNAFQYPSIPRELLQGRDKVSLAHFRHHAIRLQGSHLADFYPARLRFLREDGNADIGVLGIGEHRQAAEVHDAHECGVLEQGFAQGFGISRPEKAAGDDDAVASAGAQQLHAFLHEVSVEIARAGEGLIVLFKVGFGGLERFLADIRWITDDRVKATRFHGLLEGDVPIERPELLHLTQDFSGGQCAIEKVGADE